MPKLIHISDLHMHGGGINENHPNKGHNFEVLNALTNHLKTIEFDKLIFTGDLTDRGSTGAFQNFENWLTSTIAIPGNPKFGLNLSKEKYFVVPGNHDLFDFEAKKSVPPKSQYYQKDGKNFYDRPSFQKLPNISILKKNDLNIVFFLIDSGKRNTPANGEIREKDFFYIANECEKGLKHGLQDNVSENELSPDEFKAAVKILILHHHIFSKKNFHANNLLMDMHQIRPIMAGLFVNDVSVALSGHKHIDYDDRIRFTSALDRRAIARFAFLYLSKKYGIQFPYHLFTSKSGKPISRWVAFELQHQFSKLGAMFGKDYNSEDSGLKAGLYDFIKEQTSNRELKMELQDRSKQLLKEMKNVINSFDFNFAVANTAAKERGTTDFQSENGFYEINFNKNNELISYTVEKHHYNSETKEYEKNNNYSKVYEIFNPMI